MNKLEIYVDAVDLTHPEQVLYFRNTIKKIVREGGEVSFLQVWPKAKDTKSPRPTCGISFSFKKNGEASAAWHSPKSYRYGNISEEDAMRFINRIFKNPDKWYRTAIRIGCYVTRVSNIVSKSRHYDTIASIPKKHIKINVEISKENEEINIVESKGSKQVKINLDWAITNEYRPGTIRRNIKEEIKKLYPNEEVIFSKFFQYC